MQTDLANGEFVDKVTLACFDSGGRNYAIDVALIREIVRSHEITPLPNSPVLIEGVTELRGGLVPVLDLGRVLGEAPGDVTTHSRIVVLDCDGMLLGLCVDSATEVINVTADLLEDVPHLATQAGYELVRAVVRRPKLPPVLLLSVEALLETVYRSSLTSSGER